MDPEQPLQRINIQVKRSKMIDGTRKTESKTFTIRAPADLTVQQIVADIEQKIKS